MNWIKFDKDDESTWPDGRFRGRFVYPYRKSNQLYGSSHMIIKDIINLELLSSEDLNALSHFSTY